MRKDKPVRGFTSVEPLVWFLDTSHRDSVPERLHSVRSNMNHKLNQVTFCLT